LKTTPYKMNESPSPPSIDVRTLMRAFATDIFTHRNHRLNLISAAFAVFAVAITIMVSMVHMEHALQAQTTVVTIVSDNVDTALILPHRTFVQKNAVVKEMHNETWIVRPTMINFTTQDLELGILPLPYQGTIVELMEFNRLQMQKMNVSCMTPAVYTVPFNLLTVRDGTTYINVAAAPIDTTNRHIAIVASPRNSQATMLDVFYAAIKISYVTENTDTVHEAAISGSDNIDIAFCVQLYYQINIH